MSEFRKGSGNEHFSWKGTKPFSAKLEKFIPQNDGWDTIRKDAYRCPDSGDVNYTDALRRRELSSIENQAILDRVLEEVEDAEPWDKKALAGAYYISASWTLCETVSEGEEIDANRNAQKALRPYVYPDGLPMYKPDQNYE